MVNHNVWVKTYFTVLLLIIVQLTLIYGQSINTLQPQTKKKIAPLIQQALILKEQSPAEPMKLIGSYTAGRYLSVSAGETIGVLNKSISDIRPFIQSIGGVVGSQHGNIYAAFIPIGSVTNLRVDKNIGKG